jgi:hypothetical protein
VVNRYNEVIYDVIVPVIFHALYEVSCDIVTEEREVDLLRMPERKDCYEFMALPELIASNTDLAFAKQSSLGAPYSDKSFHTNAYCFDSIPERECFLQYIFSDRVTEVYFTGMFTSKYNGLAIQYIDPETNAIRSYYPDFIATLDDGTVQIIEVKGDNKIDDSVVVAKALAASEMATASKMEYLMIPSTKILREQIV